MLGSTCARALGRQEGSGSPGLPLQPVLRSSQGDIPSVSSESCAAARARPQLLPRCAGAGGGFCGRQHPGGTLAGPRLTALLPEPAG